LTSRRVPIPGQEIELGQIVGVLGTMLAAGAELALLIS
jgi:hypothetical protein